MLDPVRSLALAFALYAVPGLASELDLEAVAPERMVAEIVLTDSPFCGFFVVSTAHGYSLMSWRGGYEIFAEGDRIVGPLTSRGLQEIELELEPRLQAKVGALTTTVMVEETGVVREIARRTYYRRCRLDRSIGPATELVAAPR